MKFVTFADREIECCYNASHIIRVSWEEGSNIIYIDTINKGYTHIFSDDYEAKFVYYNNIMRVLKED